MRREQKRMRRAWRGWRAWASAGVLTCPARWPAGARARSATCASPSSSATPRWCAAALVLHQQKQQRPLLMHQLPGPLLSVHSIASAVHLLL